MQPISLTIDENGREVVDMNTNTARLLEIAQIISKIGLGVTVRRAYDTFVGRFPCLSLNGSLTDLSSDILNPCRFDWLILYHWHTRLWKKPGMSLKETYDTSTDPFALPQGIYW